MASLYHIGNDNYQFDRHCDECGVLIDADC